MIANPIINAFRPFAHAAAQHALVISAFAAPHRVGMELGAVLGYRDDSDRLNEIVAYRMAPDDHENFGQWVEEARNWLESLLTVTAQALPKRPLIQARDQRAADFGAGCFQAEPGKVQPV
jgi:DNA-binding SARP family transcriptional activator